MVICDAEGMQHENARTQTEQTLPNFFQLKKTKNKMVPETQIYFMQNSWYLARLIARPYES